jgi:choline dehydrogenase-like flavoprotein
VREFHDQGIVMFAAVNVPPGVIAASLPFRGAEMGEVLSDYRRMVLAGLGVEGDATGRIRVTPGGAPVATYQLSDQDTAKLVRGTALLCELLLEAGARRIHLPFGGVGELGSMDDVRRLSQAKIDKRQMEVATVHLMGTARMGGDRTRAVTDGYGMVHDADRLMVADASLFPTPIGVNPAETIHALATRNAHHVIGNRRRYLS